MGMLGGGIGGAEPGSEILRLRFAALGMTCRGVGGRAVREPPLPDDSESERRGWVPACARTRGGGRGYGVCGCGMGSRPREDESRLSTGTTGGELVSQSNVTGDHKGPPLQGKDGMTCGGVGGRAVREPPLPDDSESERRDGFPYARGHGGRWRRTWVWRVWVWDGPPPPVFTGA